MRNICIVIGSRAHYSSIKSVLFEIKKSANLNLQLITTGSAVLDRYGNVANLIKSDGFKIQASVNALVEGETLTTMAKSAGLGIIELSSIFENIKPDIVLTVGDRYETMATVISAAYMNIILAHTMGGEVSGTIDESIRHAITKFAHIHFPASKEAATRIERLGEDPSNIHLVGCPRIDLVKQIIHNQEASRINNNELFSEGVGPSFDLNKPFLLLSQHPVTTEYGHAEEQINQTLAAIEELEIPTIALWPNSDAGSEDISRGMRKLREKKKDINIHFYKNLPVNTYIRLMMRTACLVGNSSSAIREGPFIGTPAVNIGTRQNKRERGMNVLDANYNKDEIKEAIIKQINHGSYETDHTYGDGTAAEKIAKILESTNPDLQKTITY
tara:strand:+ start:1607 stop:2764 length:1158 start_codon:yes stop_codon:yes gene_type:complete